MTKTLELRTFLRKEVFKTKNILQLPTHRKRKGPHNPSLVSTDSQKSISRDNKEDLETPVEKLIHADISPPPNKPRPSKPKSEIKLHIEELRGQLLQVIAQSHESSKSRDEAARERERLIREIERLEVQERVRRGNALKGMHGIFVFVFGGIKCKVEHEADVKYCSHRPSPRTHLPEREKKDIECRKLKRSVSPRLHPSFPYHLHKNPSNPPISSPNDPAS
ncbi:hypothetical protein CJF30_00008280 [Rutstroemia sp. NJR-2017a BBW]|nr:hypothetical protein CJF30_00008280 [Rutstroemia sp. NJR-2017a BBW]